MVKSSELLKNVLYKLQDENTVSLFVCSEICSQAHWLNVTSYYVSSYDSDVLEQIPAMKYFYAHRPADWEEMQGKAITAGGWWPARDKASRISALEKAIADALKEGD